MARLKLPFELEKPSSNEFVTKASEIGYGKKKSLESVLSDIISVPTNLADIQQDDISAIAYPDYTTIVVEEGAISATLSAQAFLQFTISLGRSGLDSSKTYVMSFKVNPLPTSADSVCKLRDGNTDVETLQMDSNGVYLCEFSGLTSPNIRVNFDRLEYPDINTFTFFDFDIYDKEGQTTIKNDCIKGLSKSNLSDELSEEIEGAAEGNAELSGRIDNIEGILSGIVSIPINLADIKQSDISGISYPDYTTITVSNGVVTASLSAKAFLQFSIGLDAELDSSKTYVLSFKVNPLPSSTNSTCSLRDGNTIIEILQMDSNGVYTCELHNLSSPNIRVNFDRLEYPDINTFTFSKFDIHVQGTDEKINNSLISGLDETNMTDEIAEKLDSIQVSKDYAIFNPESLLYVGYSDYTTVTLDGSNKIRISQTGNVFAQVVVSLPQQLEIGKKYLIECTPTPAFANTNSYISINRYASSGSGQKVFTLVKGSDGKHRGIINMYLDKHATAIYISRYYSEQPSAPNFSIDVSIREIEDCPTDYLGENNIVLFNKIACIGDSLTQGVCNYNEDGVDHANVAFPNYSYPTYLHKITGVETSNFGIAGDTTAEWYNAMASADLSGYDCAIIQLGVNDAIRSVAWTTTKDAFLSIINKLKSENNNIKIFVATLIPALSYILSSGNAETTSQNLREMVAELDDSNVILLDMALYGNVGNDNAYNEGHLSAFGYKRLAEDYAHYISWYAANHKSEFSEVQFIGTEHSYNP